MAHVYCAMCGQPFDVKSEEEVEQLLARRCPSCGSDGIVVERERIDTTAENKPPNQPGPT